MQGKLTVERLRTDGNWPKLKAKAAATRHLVQYAFELMVEHNRGTEGDQKVLAIIQLMVRFYAILKSSAMFLSREAKEELPKLGERVGMLYQQLASDAYEQDLKMWELCRNCTCSNTFVLT